MLGAFCPRNARLQARPRDHHCACARPPHAGKETPPPMARLWVGSRVYRLFCCCCWSEGAAFASALLTRSPHPSNFILRQRIVSEGFWGKDCGCQLLSLWVCPSRQSPSKADGNAAPPPWPPVSIQPSLYCWLGLSLEREIASEMNGTEPMKRGLPDPSNIKIKGHSDYILPSGLQCCSHLLGSQGLIRALLQPSGTVGTGLAEARGQGWTRSSR